MKKLIYITIIAFLVLSCTKDDKSGKSEYPRNVEMAIVSEKDITFDDLVEPVTSTFQDYDVNFIHKLENSLSYSTAVINYTTKDEQNKDIRVSALVTYPKGKNLDKVILVNPVTSAAEMRVPTNYNDIDIILAATGALCVFPDYIGSGKSSDHSNLYLNASVEGRTSSDALIALFSFADLKQLPLSSDYRTYIAGYSQGAAVSLAALKDIQTLSESEQEKFRIAKVICGGGPYDIITTFNGYIEMEKEGKSIGLCSVVPLVISSMFHSYPDKFAGFEYEKIFTESALSTGVPQAVYDNKATYYDIMYSMRDKMISEILDFEYLYGDGAELLDILNDAMEKQNLCTGWKPKFPIKFFHCSPDYLVSYSNLENAINGLNSKLIENPDIYEITLPKYSHMSGYFIWINNILVGKYF